MLDLPLSESEMNFQNFNWWSRYERFRDMLIWNDFQVTLFSIAVWVIHVFRKFPEKINYVNFGKTVDSVKTSFEFDV